MTGRDAGGERVCFVHVGAPKTGTTAIQHFLVDNAEALARAGACYPVAGRCSWRPGHHNVAAELRGAPNFEVRLGTLAGFVAELVRARPSCAILSAEDLVLAHEHPEVFVRLRDAFAAIGYRARIVLYVRAHGEYVESVYAEAVKLGFTIPFERYVDDVVRLGGFPEPAWSFPFAFAGLAEGFAEIFGRNDVIVRGYRDPGEPSAVIRDFLGTLGLDQVIADGAVTWPERYENRRMTTGDVIRRLAASTAANGRAPDVEARCAELIQRDRDGAELRFAPLLPAEEARVVERFAADAECLVRDWGVDAATFERTGRTRGQSSARVRDLLVRAEQATR